MIKPNTMLTININYYIRNCLFVHVHMRVCVRERQSENRGNEREKGRVRRNI